MRFIFGLMFVLSAPILLGGLVPILLREVFHTSGGWAVGGFLIYAVVWLVIWAGPLDGGRKIPL